jgi:hypothetical protein
MAGVETGSSRRISKGSEWPVIERLELGWPGAMLPTMLAGSEAGRLVGRRRRRSASE